MICPHRFRRVKIVIIYFVYQQYFLIIVLQPSFGCYNVWAKDFTLCRLLTDRGNISRRWELYAAKQVCGVTHLSLVSYIYASVIWISFGSDNGLSPDGHQVIIWTNAGTLLNEPLGTNLSEISIKLQDFSFMKMHLKISSGKHGGHFVQGEKASILAINLQCVHPFSYVLHRSSDALQWCHDERDGVSNHRCPDCLLNRLFRHRSKRTPKLCVTGLCEGNSPVTKGQ